MQRLHIYDVNSHFIEKRDGTGQVLFKNEPHKNHLVGKRTLASGGYHLFDYDGSGRVTEASTQDHEVKLAYYPLVSWPLSDLRDGKGIEHVRRGTEIATRILERFRARRETGEARAVIQDPTGQQTIVVYDQGLVRRYCPSGTVETLQFDPEGRLLARMVYRGSMDAARVTSGSIPATAPPPRISGAPRGGGWGTRYHYTLEGDLVRVDDSARGTTVFEVDRAHRLAGEITPRGERLEYVQDAAGNVVSKPGLSGLRLLRSNFLASSQDERFEYDARHHLALRERQDGSQVRYRYDSFDMLVAIEHQDAEGEAWRWEASYDALGRRIRVTYAGKTREFFWDNQRIAAEVQPDGTFRIYQYVSPSALICMGFTDYPSVDALPESGRSYVVFADPVGMPLCIEDQEGNTVWWAQRVDPYGAIQVAEGSILEYNLRWPGHYYDPETGLHYNRWRYYDPILGRYLQSDPLGYAGSPVNLYAYAPNPLVQVDLFGLECEGDKDGGTPKDNDGQEDGPATTPRRADQDILDRHNAALDAHEAQYQKRVDAFVAFDGPPRQRGANQAKVTEVAGERALTNHMLDNEPDAEMVRGFQPGTGFDQVWVKRNPDGSVSEYIIGEGKGPGAELGTTKNKGDQMSKPWVEGTAEEMANSKDPATQQLGQDISDALESGHPPVTGRVVQSDGQGGSNVVPVDGDPAPRYN